MLAGDYISLIRTDLGRCQCGFGIPATDVVRPHLALVGLFLGWWNRLNTMNIGDPFSRCVGDAKDLRGGPRLFKRLSYDKGDGLSLMVDLVILQHVQSLAHGRVHRRSVLAIGKLRHVIMREDR